MAKGILFFFLLWAAFTAGYLFVKNNVSEAKARAIVEGIFIGLLTAATAAVTLGSLVVLF